MTEADSLAEETDPAGPLAWLMPLVVLLQTIFLLFTDVRERLKDQRRSRRLPKDWQAHYPRLREAEWAIAFLFAEATRQLLQGRDLDFAAIPDPGDAPDGFQPPMPRSALAMHKRIDAITRINAEPERYIRRHATRIAREAAAASPNPTIFEISQHDSDDSDSGDFRKRAGIGGPL
ncbi:MAG: hypothetical protein Q8R02_06210, partial [Hyphomonadaceae bacterium]|nr:hypothetical protein [Hyphomonadaceae bacterium]